ncbi:MAG: hypothetical protein M1377_05305 [Deltaproteobacteria bacterium]|nr:hypothetical protein [Deltaproteobacteria bacterium]
MVPTAPVFMTPHDLSLIAWIGIMSLIVNVPLGYLREGTRKYSAGWFLWVHLSIPLIAFLRIHNRLTPWAIPVFVAFAVAGQIFGGRARRRRKAAP